MSLQKPFRVVIVTGALAAVACGGSSGITTSDPGLDEATLAVESGMFTASAHEGELPDELLAVLNCEHTAAVFYQRVIDELEAGKPFIKVVEAEKKHRDSLMKLYTKRVPDPPGLEGACGTFAEPLLNDIPTACADAVELEDEIAAAYEVVQELDPAPPSDVLRVLENLEKTTDRHKAAFENCAES
jgi:rubrerythrin